jgi:DNA invertase Pin-like site-specific DNA recombinase
LKPKRVALYLRVSTSEQDTRNQRRELKAVAERHSWQVVKVFEDAGISGAKGSDRRPGLADLQKAVARSEIDMVAAWSVDRLGRAVGTPNWTLETSPIGGMGSLVSNCRTGVLCV